MGYPRVAIVGAGSLSSKRIYPYIGAAGARLVGVCDLDRAKAERNAALFGGTAHTDMEAMLDAERPDGVIICTGPAGHAKLAPIAMRRSTPVYTEKPPALSAADALAVARVSKETGVLCTTAFKKRYNVAYSRAKEFIGELPPDALYSLSIDYASAQYKHTGTRSAFLFDFAIHVIDLSGYLFGDAAEVFAFSKGLDAYAVSIKYANGAVGSLSLNCGRSFGIPTEEVEITARGGNFMSIHNSSSWKIAREGKCVEWREPPTFTSAGDSGLDTGHLAELVDFVQAIQQRRSTRSCIAESYKSMVLYEAVAESAATGRVVRPNYQEI
ncbi:MAG TPA: Gfo/Idh/MocA family oxidoreductase [Planctomycetota bacterium]|nr:Gfo/Idh/MocA family oxidoreductase [Planctomycetota bacterium]